MDELNLVLWLRIRFSTPRSLELRRPYGDRLNHRFGAEPAFARFDNGWIVIPFASGRGLPATEWEDHWGDDPDGEVSVWHSSTSTWKPIKTWETIVSLMKWEKRNAGTQLSKAAE